MRRPITLVFLAFICGISLEYYTEFEAKLLFITAALTAAALIWSCLSKRQSEIAKRVCLFLLVAILGSAYLWTAENNHDPLESCAGKVCTACGRVVSVQLKDNNTCQLLINGKDYGKRIVRVNGCLENPEDLVGRIVQVRGMVELPSANRNPNTFNYKLYLKTKGVRTIVSVYSSQIDVNYEDTNHIYHAIAQIKYRFLEKAKKSMNLDAYGLFAGMMFGDVSCIDDNLYEAFQKNGVAHILSVSGIHVGIVYLYISKLLGNRRSLSFQIIAILTLLFYAALSEFSPTVVRAVVMIVIHIISKVAFKRYDFTCCISASALAMLLVNPFYLFNMGFQLSYLAVFCLAVILPWANRKIDSLYEIKKNEIIARILRFLAPLVVIQLGMALITAYMFNYFSVASFFMNIPIIAISGAIIPLGMVLVPLSFMGGILFGVCAKAAELMINAMIWLNDLLYVPGVGFFNLVSPSISIVILFYTLLFFLFSEFVRIIYQRRRFIVIARLVASIILLSLMVSLAIDSDYYKPGLYFVDVGQGDCLHVRTPEGKNILIDGGGNANYDVGKNTLLPYLLKNKVNSIDLAIVTHLHDDHYLGIMQLSQKMKIKKLGIYDGNILREPEILADTNLKEKNLIYLSRGERIEIEKNVWIDVMYPEKCDQSEYEKILEKESDENKGSLILKLNYNGMKVLMTGDAGFEMEEQVMALYENQPDMLKAQILKIGHHGSRYSTGDNFLEAVNPDVAVFQVGKNNFGHPHPTTIEKCKKKGIIVYRNDLNGAVIFYEKESKWDIKTIIQ